MLVYLEGKLTHRKWTDKEGRDHYTTEVVADLLKILEKRESSYGSSSGSSSNEESRGPEPSIDSLQAQDDDLPF